MDDLWLRSDSRVAYSVLAPAEAVTVAELVDGIERLRASPGLARVRALSAAPDSALPADGVVKCPMFVCGKDLKGVVLKGPMSPEVAALAELLVKLRRRFFVRMLRRPEAYPDPQWRRVVDARGEHWFYCTSVSAKVL